MLSSAFAYLNRTILHCFASSRRSLTLARRKRGNGKYNVWQVKAKIEKAQAQESEGKRELCRTEGAEIPVLFRDLINRLCFVIWESGFSQYL